MCECKDKMVILSSDKQTTNSRCVWSSLHFLFSNQGLKWWGVYKPFFLLVNLSSLQCSRLPKYLLVFKVNNREMSSKPFVLLQWIGGFCFEPFKSMILF